MNLKDLKDALNASDPFEVGKMDSNFPKLLGQLRAQVAIFIIKVEAEEEIKTKIEKYMLEKQYQKDIRNIISRLYD